MKTSCILHITAALLFSLAAAHAGSGKGKTKVFLLVGQSNMEGIGMIDYLEEVCKDPKKDPLFSKLRKNGKWIVRDDVWIWYLGRKGPLSVGYGVRGDCVGPELQFGQVMGDHYGEQVVLIKCAWGGKSVYVDFRPPSSGGEVGPYYTTTVKNTKEVLGKLKELFPKCSGGYELVGMAWFQGWNDMCHKPAVPEYTENLANLIKDIRKDLGVPKLPVVIGETGNAREDFTKHQEAVAKRPDLKKTVTFVPTRKYLRPREGQPGYHWHRNAESYCLIGDALGKAMKELVKTRSGKFIPGIDEKKLTKNTSRLHKMILDRKYASSVKVMRKLNRSYKEVIEKSDETDTIKTERAQFKAYLLHIQSNMEEAVTEIKDAEKSGNVYQVDQLLKKHATAFGGIDAYDKIATLIRESLKGKDADISAGKSFYAMIERHNKKPGKRTASSLRWFAKRNKDNVYGPAADKAADVLEEAPKATISVDVLFR